MVNYLGDSKIARLLFGEFFSLDLQELYFKLLAKKLNVPKVNVYISQNLIVARRLNFFSLNNLLC